MQTPIKDAKEKGVLPELFTPVKTISNLVSAETAEGFFVKQVHIACRKPNEFGKYRGYVAGAGGDVWWIEHNDGSIGAYMYDEIIDAENEK